jgi:mRNA-degrading endonuclease RelE of RelBE toxin-antitoxin system
MYEIVFHTDAAEEMQAAAAYYEERVSGLGDEFLDEIEQGLHRIRQFPLLWSIYEGEYRRYLLKRFPYGLIYRLTPDRIFIIAVAHLHREPGYWKTRQ